MNIIVRNNKICMPFSDIPIGTCFYGYENDIFMRIDDLIFKSPSYEGKVNTVSLSSGIVLFIEPSVNVFVVKASVVVD